METLSDRLTSRKFMMAVGSILLALGGYFHGDVDAAAAIMAITTTALGYLAAEGGVDVVREMQTGSQTSVAARERAYGNGPAPAVDPAMIAALETATRATAIRTVKRRSTKSASVRARTSGNSVPLREA